MSASQTPETPDELLALQREAGPIPEEAPRKSEKRSAKVREVIALLQQLDTSPGDDRQIALLLLQRLEACHDAVVEQMVDAEAEVDRLMPARQLLASVTLA